MISVLLSTALALQVASSPPATSPTALEMSKVIVAGAKDGLSSSGAYEPSCIAAIPDGAAADAVQQHVVSTLSDEESRYLDAFFGSELGQRFNAGSIAARAAAAESRSHTPAAFTLAEAKLAGDVTHSPAAAKLFAAINSTTGPFIDAIDAIILPLAARCRVAP